jgi:hypothetical protein
MSIQAAAMIASPLLNIASKGIERLPDFPKFSLGSSDETGKKVEESGKADDSSAVVGGQAERKLKDLLESILERLRKAGIATSSSFEMKLDREGTVSASSEDLEFAQNVETWLQDHPETLKELQGAVEGYRQESMTPFEHFPVPKNDDRRQSLRMGRVQGEVFMAWEGS